MGIPHHICIREGKGTKSWRVTLKGLHSESDFLKKEKKAMLLFKKGTYVLHKVKIKLANIIIFILLLLFYFIVFLNILHAM